MHLSLSLRFLPKNPLSITIALFLRSNPPEPLLPPVPHPSPSQILTPPTVNATTALFRSLLCSPCRTFSSQSRSQMPQRKRFQLLPDESQAGFDKIIKLIREDASGLEAQFNQQNLRISPSFVLKVLIALNEEEIPALRFFNWAVNDSPGFTPSAKIYNQLVNNLGVVSDYETMITLLTELSHKGFCLTEKAFAFLSWTRSDSLASLVARIVDVLNCAGSCRGSGIFSLIRHLCSVNAFDLAITVMDKTSRKTRYYNSLIAAKCKNGDFQGAQEVFDEMAQSNCDPDMNSFNYILGCLLKRKRGNEACDLLEAMERLGSTPDELTYEMLAFHGCEAGRIDSATQFLDRMLLEGLRPRITTHAMFIKGYFSLGREADACRYVVDTSIRDIFSVNENYSLLGKLFCKSRRASEAGRVLFEMMEKGFRPNQRVYFRVVKMLLQAGRRDMASQLKNKFLKFELHSSSP